MANERLIFEVVAEGKNLKAVQLDAHKLADGIERTDSAYNKSAGAQERFHRGAKGVAGTSANTTKNFSKMRSAMGGSSGIVAAYATLAANVFAVTAAFNALQRAAAFQELARGLEFVGRSAGQHLGQVADSLKEITGAAVSTEQAMRTTAVGLSAGFNPSQLEDLTRVAKGASLALGRDLGDALDRLVRGTAKLEPEILDELGIMVRLDDATEAYAVKLGKTAGALTRFERQQAFLNATTEQGLKKFGQIAKELDPNPYDRLSAAFDNLVKSGLNIVNMFLTPLVEALAESQGMLFGVGTAFVGTISGQMLPGMMQMASNTAMMADETRKNAATQLQSLGATRQHSDAINNLLGKIHEGTATTKEYDATVNQLNQSINKHQRDLDGMNEADEGYAKGAARKNRLMDQQRDTLTDLDHAFRQQAVSQAQFSSANAIGAASQLDFRGSIESTKDAFEKFEKGQAESIKGSKKQNKALQMLERGFFKAGLSARVFGAGLMSAIPIIGIAITVASALYAALTSLIPEDKIKKSVDAATARINEFIKANEQLIRFLDKETTDSGEAAAASIKVYSGGLSGAAKDLKDFAKVADKAAVNRKKSAEEELRAAQQSYNMQAKSRSDAARNEKRDEELAQKQAVITAAREKLVKATREANAAEMYDRESIIRAMSQQITGLQHMDNEYVNVGKATGILKNIRTNLQGMTEEQLKSIDGLEEFISMAERVEIFNKNIENSERLSAELNKEVGLIFKKAATPFDRMMDKVSEMGGALETAMRMDDAGIMKEELGAITTQMKKLGASNFFDGKNADQILDYIDNLKDAQYTLATMPATIKRMTDLSKKLNKAGAENQETYKRTLDIQEDISALNLATIDAEIALTEFAAENASAASLERIEASKKLHELAEKRLEVETTMNSVLVRTAKEDVNRFSIKAKTLDIEMKTLDAAKATADAKREEAKMSRQIAALETKGSTSGALAPHEEARIAKQTQKARKDQVDNEARKRKDIVQNDYDLMSAKEKLLKEELGVAAVVAATSLQSLRNKRTEILQEKAAAMDEAGKNEDKIAQVEKTYNRILNLSSKAITRSETLGDTLEAAYTGWELTDYTTAIKAQNDLIDGEAKREKTGIDLEVAELSAEAVNNYREQVGILQTMEDLRAEALSVQGLTEESVIRQNIETFKTLETTTQLVDMLKEINTLRLQEFDAIQKKHLLEIKIAKLGATNLSDADRMKTTAFDEIRARKAAENEMNTEKKTLMQTEFELETTKIKIEQTMADMRHALILQEYDLIDAEMTAAKAIAKLEGKDVTALEEAQANVSSLKNTAAERYVALEQQAKVVTEQRLQTMEKLNEAKQTENELEIKSLENKRKMEAVAAASGSGTLAQRIAAFQAAGGTEGAEGPGDDLGFGDKLKVMKGFTSDMVEQMKTLGPDGEIVGAAIQGAFVIGEAWTGVGDVFNRSADSALGVATSGEKAAAILGAVGQTIGQINAIMAQSDQQKINKTQKAIDMEKKRDGKSKESLAKIQALEKKKDAQARKAFERNKKMQMAQIIISTTSAAMAAWSPPPVGTGPLLGGFLSAAIVAMGAASLAMVAGTSYDGGGAGGVGGGMPKSVSVGERNNKVDVARGGNAGGELAYLRGERGTGSSSADFKPSFGGRYRAAGGTAYMVGEQGPELFVPETPGRIMEQEDSAPNMGGIVNANFTINAIDATNMQETLTSQRGNIIGMIREAANASGETFLETVDTLGLQSEGAK